jgi:uncharacterized protein (TIGR03790 family)
MAITKDNFIVVYIYGNLDSEEFANYYINTYGMDTTNVDPSASSGTTDNGIYWQIDGQKVGIQSAITSEVLTESQFLINVEEPLQEALNAQELENRNIWGIVLGYKIPGGYYDSNPSNEDIISATSRLSRIEHIFSSKTGNPIFGRQVFSRFDETDAEKLLIVSRIDGPNLQFAKSIVDNGDNLNKQQNVNGTFYIDPYSDRATTGAEDYTNLLLDFKDNFLPTLNLPQWTTTLQDPYIDPIIPFVEADSFIWSWFSDRSTTSFFQNSNAIRVFAYNADYDGAFEVRSETGKRWPYLALNARYAATAGAMSDPTIPGFLDPNSFYYSLLRGATIGESFYFSVPHLDWTITLFGDPLVTCSFPGAETVEEEEVINEHVVWEIMSKDLAQSAANLYKKQLELEEVAHDIVDLTTLENDTTIPSESPSIEDIVVVDDNLDYAALVYPANNLFNKSKEWQRSIKALIDKLFDFPNQRYFSASESISNPTINQYLLDQGFRVSSLLADITSGTRAIDEENLYPEGWWEFEFTLEDDNPNAFTNYHFLLEVSADESFSNILISKDSLGIASWTYEKEKETFVPLTFTGVSSSYIGRKVRYTSRFDSLIGLDEFLTRGETYYFRVTQYNVSTGVTYTPRIFTNIIYT